MNNNILKKTRKMSVFMSTAPLVCKYANSERPFVRFFQTLLYAEIQHHILTPRISSLKADTKSRCVKP